jgi:hypothetical protein
VLDRFELSAAAGHVAADAFTPSGIVTTLRCFEHDESKYLTQNHELFT